MSDELREKMRRLIVLHITSSGHTVDELTDAAIALIRADTLEEAEARIEQLEAALRCVEEACDALMVMEDGETFETLTGYSRGAYFTAKYIKTRAALEASDE